MQLILRKNALMWAITSLFLVGHANYTCIIIPGSSWALPLPTKTTQMASSAHDSLIKLANSKPSTHTPWWYLNYSLLVTFWLYQTSSGEVHILASLISTCTCTCSLVPKGKGSGDWRVYCWLCSVVLFSGKPQRINQSDCTVTWRKYAVLTNQIQGFF